MISNDAVQRRCAGKVIPAARTNEDFRYALTSTQSSAIILLFGDIIILPDLLEQAKRYNKQIIVHLELLNGISNDKAGVMFLSNMGVTALITTKSHLAKIAHEEGMFVIQRLFMMDSGSLKTGIHLLRNFKPDAIELLPASLPIAVIRELSREFGVPIWAGGLITVEHDVLDAFKKGISAVSTSKTALWNLTVSELAALGSGFH